MPIIQVENLTFAYDTAEDAAPRAALQDVTLNINAGEFVAVLGHNGSGKSTFAKHLNAILLPTGGAVYVDGLDTRDEDKTFDIRAAAGMVFQNPDNQIVATVVEEDVAFACENLGLPPTEIRARVDEALAAVGMTAYAQHAPHLLSGGQKQRVAIAGVLAMAPKIIVLDEPTAMLDPSGRREVMAALLELNRTRGMTVVLITHHMDEAAQASRVVVMDRGSVAMDGPPEAIFSQVERVRALSLAVPQTVEILYRLNQTGADLPLSNLTVAHCAAQIMAYLGANAQ
jgi:energy-coupling factor transport system ATP-binding protein